MDLRKDIILPLAWLLTPPVLIGLIIEFLVHCNIYLLTVNNFSNISLTIIQIQATLITLIIAIIALLSGLISKSYFGIPINLYYTERKPHFLKFNVVLIYELLLVILNIFAHILELYNFVTTVFITSISIILIFVIRIFEIFNDQTNAYKEIKNYFSTLIDQDINYSTLGTKFIDDWKKLASSQSYEQFCEYYKLYKKLLSRIINKDRDIDTINSFNTNIAFSLLRHESLSTKKKGVEFVINIYNELSELLVRTKNNPKIDKPIYLINHVAKDWLETVHALNINEIEHLKIKQFLKNALLLSAYFDNSSNNQSEINVIYEIGYNLGFLLDTHSKYEQNANYYWWGEMINHLDYYNSDIPEIILEKYLKINAILNFYICKGYLIHGETKLVKEYLFKKLEVISLLFSSPNFKFLPLLIEVLLVHCFMYHISLRIPEKRVNKATRNNIKNLITDKEVINYTELFFWQLIQHPDYLTKDIEYILKETINENENFNTEFNVSGVENVESKNISEYFLYITLMVNRFSFKTNSNILKILDVTNYRSYTFENIQKSLKIHFDELSKIISPNYSDVDEMIHTFNLFMSREIKDLRIHQTKKAQEEFTHNQVNLKIRKLLLDSFSNIFDKFSIPYGIRDIHKHKIHLLRVCDYTEILNNEISPIYLNKSFEILMYSIVKILKVNGINEVDRLKDLQNDSKFREFITNGNYFILLGGMSIFSQKDHINSQKHIDFLNERNLITIPYSKVGIATNTGEIYINITDVIVDIQSPSIEQSNDINFSKNNDSGTIIYNQGSGINLEFNESEFEQLITNERKIIDISVNMEIGIKEQDCHNRQIVIIK
ncbi:hypothetical protein [Succinimonas sp.]|uniref:hypothetical protein n=1 Tax=Succinimonas sp. TaxID=1936151 RepID=UPI00386E95B6